MPFKIKMIINDKNIFLLDGVGAFVSLLSTGFVLPYFSTELGLSIEVLQTLATVPFALMIYSFSCLYFVKAKPVSESPRETLYRRRRLLGGLIIANLFYCVVSGAITLFYEVIKVWGVLVLSLEVLVVLLVVAIEVRIYRSLDKKLAESRENLAELI